jgi:hypothetical protein
MKYGTIMELMLTSTLLVDKILPESSYELENVIAIGGVKYPEKGVTTYYGFTSSTTSLAHAFKHAVSINQELHGVTLSFTFDEDVNIALGLEDLSMRKVLSIDKLKSDLGEQVRGHWKNFLMEIPGAWEDAIKSGYTDARGNFQVQGFTNAVAERPYLLDKLWSLPEFNHLHIILYSVLEAGGLSNRATVFRRGNLNTDEYGLVPEIRISRYPSVGIDFKLELQD